MDDGTREYRAQKLEAVLPGDNLMLKIYGAAGTTCGFLDISLREFETIKALLTGK